jgi:hypothetical protein
MAMKSYYSHAVVKSLRKEREGKALGEGEYRRTIKVGDEETVTVHDFRHYECVSLTTYFGLKYHKGGIALHVLPMGHPRSYKILIKVGLKFVKRDSKKPTYNRQKIQAHLATLFYCPLLQMLRNINWRAAQSLLETPAALELIAYLDGNNDAIGRAAREKIEENGGKSKLEEKLYDIHHNIDAEIRPRIKEIADELNDLKIQVEVLEDDVAEHTAAIAKNTASIDNIKSELLLKADRSDVESLEQSMETKLQGKADRSDMETLEQATDTKLQGKADRSDMETLEQAIDTKLQGKADRSDMETLEQAIDTKLQGKADQSMVEQLAESLAELKVQVNTPRSSLRHPRHSVGFNDGANSKREIPNKAEARRPTNATHCVIFPFRREEIAQLTRPLATKQVCLGILPLLAPTRVAIVDSETRSDVIVSGQTHTLHLGPDTYPDIILVDWRIDGHSIVAKIVVDLRSLALVEPLPRSGALPESVYWGIGRYSQEQMFVFEYQDKIVDTIESYGENIISHGTIISLGAKQKKGSGMPSADPVKALLLGPDDVDEYLP